MMCKLIMSLSKWSDIFFSAHSANQRQKTFLKIWSGEFFLSIITSPAIRCKSVNAHSRTLRAFHFYPGYFRPFHWSQQKKEGCIKTQLIKHRFISVRIMLGHCPRINPDVGKSPFPNKHLFPTAACFPDPRFSKNNN